MRVSSTRSRLRWSLQAGLGSALLLLIGGCTTIPQMPRAPQNELRELLLKDMQLPHEQPPNGLPENWNFGRSGRVGMGNQPGDFRAFIPWGQIYKVRGGQVSPGTQVEIRHMLACVLPKGAGARWTLLSEADGVTGRAYVEDYKDNQSRDTPIWQLPGGVTRMQFLDGYNLHFWSAGGRVDIDPSNIQGLYVLMQARWVEGTGGTSPPPLMFSVGADYWRSKTAKWDQQKANNDAAIGRFRMLGADWRTFTAATVGAEILDRYPPDCTYRVEGKP